MIDARSQVTNPAGFGSVSEKTRIGIAVHHSVSGTSLGVSATPAQELAHIRAIDQYHVSQGYGGFGYHCAVFASGRVYQCGDLPSMRAHVAGRNHELLGVVLIGDFSIVLPEQPQIDGLAWVINYFTAYLGRDVPVKGHTEWALPSSQSSCPGRIVELDLNNLNGGKDVLKRYTGPALANPDFFHDLGGPQVLTVWTTGGPPSDWQVPEEAVSLEVCAYIKSGGFDLIDLPSGAKAGYCGAGVMHYRVYRNRGANHAPIGLVGDGVIDKLELLGYYLD